MICKELIVYLKKEEKREEKRKKKFFFRLSYSTQILIHKPLFPPGGFQQCRSTALFHVC